MVWEYPVKKSRSVLQCQGCCEAKYEIAKSGKGKTLKSVTRGTQINALFQVEQNMHRNFPSAKKTSAHDTQCPSSVSRENFNAYTRNAPDTRKRSFAKLL